MSNILHKLGALKPIPRSTPDPPSQPQPTALPWHRLPPSLSSRGKVLQFTNCRVYSDGVFKSEDLWVRDGRVIDPARRFWEAATFSEFACDVIVDCEGLILCPGFLDLQFNGALRLLLLFLSSLFPKTFLPFECSPSPPHPLSRRWVRRGLF